MKQKILAVTLASLYLPAAQAGTYGTDLNNTMLPATGGMGGASIAHSIEPAAAVFGNPATLTQFNEGTSFTFGATFFKPKVRNNHDGSITGTPWSGQSKATNYLVPTVAITQAFSPDLVAGIGLTVQSGVGSDFRAVPNSLDPTGELIVFMANAGAAYQLTDNLSLGATLTLGNGYFQASLSNDTASAHSFGIRATLGAKYDLGATSFGLYYRSPLKIEYEEYISNGGVPVTPGGSTFWSDHVEQPQEIALGISNSSLMGGDLLISADVIHKDWSGAAFYEDFYRDQTVFALGTQLTTGKAEWRLGFSHARSPIKQNLPAAAIIGIGGNTTIGAPGGGQIPVTGAVVEYFQATNAGAVWEDNITAGFGYQLLPNVSVDAHLAFALNESEAIGGTQVSAQAWQVGFGLTWEFK